MEGFNHYRPSSSQDTFQHRRSYHVFLSFRGPDVRKSLVDHLFQSLSTAGFHVFLDTERLEKGENIEIDLKEAIRDSTVHIPIFSSGYASSAWCLHELWLIWTCKSTETKTIPLFYDVEPSVVRHQTGIYGESFKALCSKGRHSTAEMDKWKEALHGVSLLSGWSLSLTADGYEGRLVKQVVMDLLQTIKIDWLHVAKHPVGLSDPIKEVTKLLEIDNHIRHRTVGIWGMGGIGKTTLSKAVYNNVHNQFEASCFVSDIRATANESVKGLVNLQRQILSELVPVGRDIYSVAQGIMQMKTHLASKKVLVILDDVDDEKQLDALAGDCYGPGSRIIITTRDEKVLQLGKIDKIHPVKGLSQDKAVQLFSWHAFLRARPENGYEAMTLKIVNSCQGLPLSLEILGAHLYGERSMRIWSETLQLNHRKVYQTLKISYDALSDQEQQMFLDIACFFVTDLFRHRTLTFYLDFWEALGWKTVYTSLRSLEEKSLIRIEEKPYFDDNLFLDGSSYSRFWMHDHVRDLGRQIVEDESPHDPSKRSRLWCEKDILSVLEHKEEMPNARGLMLPRLKLQQMNNLLDNLALMHNLKFLFSHGPNVDREIIMLPRGLRYLFMREWNFGNSDSCFSLQGPLQSLYYLRIRDSSLVGLPSDLHSLKELDILGCPLREFPRRFENLINLRKLNLRNCYKLDELPPLPESLVSLRVLDCGKLKKFSNMSHVTKLESLQLIACVQVEELPPLPKSLVHIMVHRCSKVEKLSSMSHMIKLETLHMCSCESLAQLPELNWLQSLRELTLTYCTNLKELPPLPKGLLKLTLYWCTNLKELPPLPKSLVHIRVHRCSKLEKLSSMSHMIKLETLHVSTCYCLAQLPELNWLQSLRELTLCYTNLKELPPLPKGLLKLTLDWCRNLKELPPLPKGLLKLNLDWCENLKELPPLPESLINLSTKYCYQLGINLKELPPLPKGLLKLTLDWCRNLKELPPLPKGLSHLSTVGCYQLGINALRQTKAHHFRAK